MKRFFYGKLAFAGVKKNGKTYGPYLLTCVTMVMVSYLLAYLSYSRRIYEMKGGDTMQAMLTLGMAVFWVFALIFLFYTNSFLIRRRKQEFGLYNVLGMGKWNVARILIWESILMAAISFLGGLGFGILFSKAAELWIARVLGNNGGVSFSVEWKAVLQTIMVFAVIFGLILLNSLRQIQKSDPIELLRSASVGEKPPKGNILLALLGAGMLGTAYYMAVTIEDPVTAVNAFFLAVLLVILATYLLFVSGSVTFLRLLKRNRRYYYRENHFVSVSSMIYRMKRSGAGLASICVLSTMVLVMLSAVVCLYLGKEDGLRRQYPRDVQILTHPTNADEEAAGGTQIEGDSVRAGNDTDAQAKGTVPDLLQELVDAQLTESGLEAERLLDYRYLAVTAFFSGDHAVLSGDDSSKASGQSSNGTGGNEASGMSADGGAKNDAENTDTSQLSYTDACVMLFVPLEDYNRITGQQESLEPDEILVSCSREGTYGYDILALHGYDTWRVKAEVPEFVTNEEASRLLSLLWVVVPDMNLLEQMELQQEELHGVYGGRVYRNYGFDLDVTDEVQSDFLKGLLKRLRDSAESGQPGTGQLRGYDASCIADERTLFYGLYGGLFVIGIILGFVFVLATVLIMYYKQITEGYEDQSRFEVMRKVGMTRRGIRKSINSQMLTVFFLPLLIAGMHLAFAFPIVYKILLLFGLSDRAFLIRTAAAAFLIFSAFYIFVYVATSRVYYRIVSGKL